MPINLDNITIVPEVMLSEQFTKRMATGNAVVIPPDAKPRRWWQFWRKP